MKKKSKSQSYTEWCYAQCDYEIKDALHRLDFMDSLKEQLDSGKPWSTYQKQMVQVITKNRLSSMEKLQEFKKQNNRQRDTK